MEPHDASSLGLEESRRSARGRAAERTSVAPASESATAPAAGSLEDLFEPDPSSSAKPKRKRRVWLWVVLTILLVLIGVGVLAVVLGLQFLDEAKDARSALERAKSGISALNSQLGTADQSQLQTTADQVTADVAEAAAITEGPLWDVAAQVPFVGHNVDAVQRVTRAVDVLVERALPPGLVFMTNTDFTKITVEGGGINLEPFRQVQGSVPVIAAAFTEAKQIVDPIDTAALLPEIGDPLAEILAVIDQTAPAMALAEKYLPTLLDIAGSGGTKTYLLIFQNNAESRATGGNPAASMAITVTDGRMGYVDQASVDTFIRAGVSEMTHAELPPETTGLYLPTLTRHSQDFNFTPDYPTTAQLFKSVWASSTGTAVDGVISVDPVVLSHMLAVAGPVTLETGEKLTSENAVQLLLSETYKRFPLDGPASDAFFADTAKRVFMHLTSSSWDPLKMLDALKLSADEQRVYLAFTDPAAQALAAEIGVDGGLAPDTTAQTQLGLYLNDSSVSKLEYYLDSAITASCDASARTITTTMTLRSDVTPDVSGNYTLGRRNGSFGIPQNTMMLDVLFFAPPGGQITRTDPERGEVGQWERTGVEKGNTAVSKTVFVNPGETKTVSYTVALPQGQLGPLNLRYTPTATSTAVTIDSSCDALFPPSADGTPASAG